MLNDDLQQTAPTRTIIGNALKELLQNHDNIWLVTPDFGGYVSDIKKQHANRFIDVGIAEQTAVGVAAGLALDGNIPYVLGMAPFLSMRSCEQVRTAVCYHNLPVRFIATNSGTATNAGSTHYGMEDIAIVKSIVNMSVVSISDPNMIGEMLRTSVDYPGPVYFRLARGREDPVIYKPGTVDFKIGKSVHIKEGSDVVFFSHGEMVVEAIKAARELEKEGIHAGIYDMYSIKPVDINAIRHAAAETDHILVLEDHLMDGGLASSIADVLVNEGICPKVFKRLGVPQVYPGFGGTEIRKKYGFDAAAAVAAVRAMMLSQ